jgi:hypothetical protein
MTPNTGLLSAILNTPKEPFRMEIVEAQGVREVLFDAETGRPLQTSGETSTAAGPTLEPSIKPKKSKNETSTSTSDSDASNMLDEFPINLDALKKK